MYSCRKGLLTFRYVFSYRLGIWTKTSALRFVMCVRNWKFYRKKSTTTHRHKESDKRTLNAPPTYLQLIFINSSPHASARRHRRVAVSGGAPRISFTQLNAVIPNSSHADHHHWQQFPSSIGTFYNDIRVCIHWNFYVEIPCMVHLSLRASSKENYTMCGVIFLAACMHGTSK